MNVVEMRDRLVRDDDAFVRSFVDVADERIKRVVDGALGSGVPWPSPLVPLNPAFEPGGAIDDLVGEGLLHRSCAEIFRARKTADSTGFPMRLHEHQDEAIRVARTGATPGTTTIGPLPAESGPAVAARNAARPADAFQSAIGLGTCRLEYR